jgi:hypothetical protein
MSSSRSSCCNWLSQPQCPPCETNLILDETLKGCQCTAGNAAPRGHDGRQQLQTARAAHASHCDAAAGSESVLLPPETPN